MDESHKTRCNNCHLYFKSDDELEIFKEVDGHYKGCPACKTDSYLMDLEGE